MTITAHVEQLEQRHQTLESELAATYPQQYAEANSSNVLDISKLSTIKNEETINNNNNNNNNNNQTNDTTMTDLQQQ